MRTTLACACALTMLAAALPSFAQDVGQPQAPPSQAAPPSPVAPPESPLPQAAPPQGGTSRKAALRACMAPYEPAIRKQVAAHMHQWQAANAGVANDAVAAERQRFKRSVSRQYIHQCRAQLNAAPQQQ